MFYVLIAVLLILLLAGGILAYKNSKLLTLRGTAAGASTSGSALKYSVYNVSGYGTLKEEGAVELFRWTLQANLSGSSVERQPGSTLVLCRVPGGKGEMILRDARSWMLNTIRDSIDRGALTQHEAFLDKAVGSDEIELIIQLTQAAEEEPCHADHHS
jgi:hypothetical protein